MHLYVCTNMYKINTCICIYMYIYVYIYIYYTLYIYIYGAHSITASPLKSEKDFVGFVIVGHSLWVCEGRSRRRRWPYFERTMGLDAKLAQVLSELIYICIDVHTCIYIERSMVHPHKSTPVTAAGSQAHCLLLSSST